MSNEDERTSFIPSSPSVSVNSEPPCDTNDGEDRLLDTEMQYLNALDSRLSEIEQRRLNDYIKHGDSYARKNYKQAIKAFRNDIDSSISSWRALQKRFTAEFGFSWSEYSSEDDIGGPEEECNAPQEWELFQKQTPSIKATRMLRKRKHSGDTVQSNKKININENTELEELETTDSEYEDV